jgi:hypothetical protein
MPFRRRVVLAIVVTLPFYRRPIALPILFSLCVKGGRSKPDLGRDPGSEQAATWSAPGTELVPSFLTHLVHNARSRRRTLTLLRGAQAGFLAHGLLLTIPDASDLTALNGPGLNTVPITGRIVDRSVPASRRQVVHPCLGQVHPICR